MQDERTHTLSVSSTALTVLQMPAPVLQAVSSQAGLEVKARDQTVILAPVTAPSDLVVLTGSAAYVFRLMPDAARGPDTVVIEDRRGARAGVVEPAPEGDTGDDEGTALVLDLVKLGLTGRWPGGATVAPLPPSAQPRWLELAVTQAETAVVRRGGRAYEIQRWRLRNDTSRPLSLRETEWYTGEELAIALDRQLLEPGEHTVVSVVRPAPAEAGPEGAPAGAAETDPDPEAAGRAGTGR